jgi:transposase InsO family protein
LEKGDFKIIFDKVFATKAGYILGIEMIQKSNEMAQANLTAGREINVNELHEMLGHPYEAAVRKTAETLGLKTTGTFVKCENCALSKARRKNLNKEKVERAGKMGERLFMDISSIKTESFGSKKFWLLLVDDATDCSFSFFLSAKSQLSQTVRDFIKDIKMKHGIETKIIRCDNGGENKGLEKDAKKEGLGLTFEYTAPRTPQQNGRVERKFASLYGRVRAMLNGARVTKEIRGKLWAECANTATLYENMIVGENQSESAYKSFYGKDPNYARYLKVFGEIAVITDHKKIKGKIEDRGRQCMFLGYSEKHTGDTYRFLNLQTEQVEMSRDVIWLGKNYGEWKGLTSVNTTLLEDENNEGDDDDDEDPQPAEVMSNETVNNNAQDTVVRVPRIVRELRNLRFDSGDGNRTANQELEKLHESESETGRDKSDNTTAEEFANVFPPAAYSFVTREILLDAVEMSNGDDEIIEPKTFQKAWNHENPEQREKWRTAIKKEFHDMIQRGVWRNMKRRDMPSNRRCVKCKWLFKVKRNGVFRARLVACGYSQIPGVDFLENFAPVINDVTWRILLVAMLLWNLDGILIDVECAFLEGELEEEVYMDCPEGLENTGKEDCLKLEKSIYGLVQSARQWWKKLVKILKEIGFKSGNADPCLLTKRDNDGLVLIALYVDDCLCIGDKKAIKKVVEELRNKNLNLKVDDDLKDYLSCEINFSNDRRSAILHQSHILKSIRKEFGKDVEKMQEYKTPGTPGHGQVRGEEGVTVSSDEQRRFRMGVGKLLYLVKHTRPDIANSVRELSKMLDCTNPSAMSEMYRVIKYVMDTENYGLKMAPKSKGNGKMFDIETFCDSDFAGDKETRISVSGFIIYLCGVAISWRSKAMRHVTLSSSEAEYVSLSEAAKEVKFIVQVIESMGIEVEKPVVIRVDNIGAIFMANNVTTSNRTKHVDVRYRYVNEFVEDGFVTIIFVRSEENDSDGFTKNLGSELYEKHSVKFIADKSDIENIGNRKIDEEQFATGRVSKDVAPN